MKAHPLAKTFYVDYTIVKVVCPYNCKKKTHIHGSCGGDNYWGYRTPHCEDSHTKKDYYVTKLNAGGDE